MKPWFICLITLFLAGCTTPVPTLQPNLPTAEAPFSPTSTAELFTPTSTVKPAMNSAYPDLGPAPELAGEVWLNTESPLRLAKLRGKVVLVDMWTFG